MIKKHCKRKSQINNIFIVNDDNSDKEARRTTRGGVLLAVIALVVGILSVIFNFMKKFSQIIVIGNEVPVEYSYLCMYSILIFIILLIFDGLVYVIGDIGRYNVKNENYKKGDKTSDGLYDDFIFDVKCGGVVICIEMVLFILIYIIYYPWSYINVMYIGLLLLVCATGIYNIVHKRKVIFAKWKSILEFVGKLVIIFLLIVPFVISDRESKISVSFDNNKILIENQSSQDNDGMEIKIYIFDNGEKVSEHIVCDTELLLAEERNNRFIEEIGGEISYSSGNSFYWIYEYDMSKVRLKPGKYNVIIDVTQGVTKLHFENEFIYNKKQIKYAKAEFVKRYK